MNRRMHNLVGTVVGNWLLLAVLAGLGILYAGGGAGRERQVALLFIYIVLVVGLQIFVGNSGVFSLGHMAFGGIAGYTAAILTAAPATKAFAIGDAPFGLAEVQLGPLTGSIVAVVVAVAVSALIGSALTRLSGLGAIIVTLAVLVVTENAIINWDALTGGAEAFFGYPIAAGKTWPIVAAFAAVAVASGFRYTRTGLRLQASREDELAAAASGVDIVRTRLVAWVLSALVVAVGGILLTFFVGTITPSQFSLHITLLTMAMLVLGGMKSVRGAVVGAVVVFFGSELTRYLADGPEVFGFQLPQLFGLSTLFLGAVLLFVMILRPDGLAADGELGHWLLRRWPVPVETSTAVPARAGRARLTADGVRKDFQGLTAVNAVSIDLADGEIVGLIGPNGAGKTTLLNLISGVLPLSSGDLRLNQQPIANKTIRDITRIGIARTFQNIRLFEGLKVWENLVVADSTALRHRPTGRRLGPEAGLEAFGLTDLADNRAGEISYGSQRHLELARAVALAPDLLLLDEPSAGLNEVETEALMNLIADLRDQRGFGVLVVDHDLGFIMSVCDRIYVMDRGSRIAVGTPAEIREVPEVVAAYLGQRSTEPTKTVKPAEPDPPT